MKKVRAIKVWTDGFNAINQKVEDLLVLYEFFESKEATEEETDAAYNQTIEAVEKLEAKNMLRNEEDRLGAVLKINAGAGGTENLSGNPALNQNRAAPVHPVPLSCACHPGLG